MHHYPNGRVVLLTGASTGIGKAIAQTLSAQGYYVYGAARSCESMPAQVLSGIGFIQTLPMDVTDETSVRTGVEHVLSCANGAVDILINCAGSGIAGPIEQTSAGEAHAQLDVNFYGALRTIQAVLPAMRAQKRGLIINIGSVAGFIPIPFQGMYSASKYALEAMGETLSMEVRSHGIRVCTLCPGDTRTEFTQKRVYAAACKQSDIYKEPMSRAVYAMVRDERNGVSPDKIAKAAAKVAGGKHVPVRKVPGANYKLFALLVRLVPKRFELWVLRLMYIRAKPCSDGSWSYEKDVMGS